MMMGFKFETNNATDCRFCLFAVLLIMLPVLTKPQSTAAVQLSEMQNGNQITLQCQLTNNGLLVNNAKFYRNGLEYDSSENASCLRTIATAPPSNGRLDITLTADCEGYYLCGHEPDSLTTVLSAPLVIYAYPIPLTTGSINIEVPLGDDIKLQCPFTVSALNSYSVSWQKHKNSIQTKLDIPLNNDYSIVLRNVSFEDSAIYVCIAVSIPFGSFPSGRRSGPIITVQVVQAHVPPEFTTDLSFRKDIDSNYIFNIQARGTDPLMFYWYIEDKMMTPKNFVVQSTDYNQVLEKRSELLVTDLEEIADDKLSLNLTIIVTNTNDDEMFIARLTSIILIFEDDDCRTPDPLEEATRTDIFLYVLGFALLLSWILIFLLVIAIVYYKLQLKLLKRRSWRTGNTSHQIPLQGDCPSVDDSSSNTEDGVTEAAGADMSIQPSQDDPGKWCNPISYILYHVAIRYRNESPSDRSLIQSFHQILIEVLNTQSMTNDHEVVNWVIDIRDRVREFGDKLLKEEWAKRRQLSQEYAAKQSKQTNVSGSNETASILTEDDEDADFVDAPEQVESEEMSLQVARETGCVRGMTHIQSLLDQWITKHQQQKHYQELNLNSITV